MRRLLLACSILVLSCTPARGRGGDDGDACADAKQCGDACCGAEQKCADGVCVACSPTTCDALGHQCGSAEDGCGGDLDCGGCDAPLTCGGGGRAHFCGEGACVPKTCRQLGKDCGTTDDGCGTPIECGSCRSGERCGGGGGPNVCGTGACVAESDRQICTRLGRNCGTITAFDNCDNSRVVPSCGECAGNDTCQSGRCSCIAESDAAFCARLQKSCGSFTGRDDCNQTRTADCGGCGSGLVCSGNRCADAPKSPVGAACDSDDACEGDDPRCLGVPGGYCVQLGCTPDGNDCPAGSSCFGLGGANGCLKRCTRTSDCGRASEGYVCDEDGVCWNYRYQPVNAGRSAVGAACTSDGACESNNCLLASVNGQPSGYAGGYCTADCVVSRPESCPTGASCLGGLCHKQCTATSQCRTGHACLGGVCIPNPALTHFGEPCTESNVASACGVGACMVGPDEVPQLYPEGYCTNSPACTVDAQCGAEGVCRAIVYNGPPVKACEKKCTSNAQCRDGYECANGSCRVIRLTNAALVRIGEGCGSDSDCVLSGGRGGACLPVLGGNAASGGYCIGIGCSLGGSECGGNGTCLAAGFSPYGVCLRACASDSDCRENEGYRCEASLGVCFPG